MTISELDYILSYRVFPHAIVHETTRNSLSNSLSTKTKNWVKFVVRKMKVRGWLVACIKTRTWPKHNKAQLGQAWMLDGYFSVAFGMDPGRCELRCTCTSLWKITKKCYIKVLENFEKNASMYILCSHLFVQILA
jgi:hypothetical protein